MSRTRRKPKGKSLASNLVGQPSPTCDGGRCIQPTKASSSTSSTMPLNPQNDALKKHDDSYLASILPRDYYVAMLEAAKYGFLYAYIAATPVEFFNHHFKKRGMTGDQIYYANQAIRATAYLGLSVYLGFLDLKSLMLAIGAPISSAILKYQGSSELIAPLAPAGLAAAYQIAADFSHCGKTALSLMAGIGGTLLGNHLAKKTYSLAAKGLFQINKYIWEA